MWRSCFSQVAWPAAYRKSFFSGENFLQMKNNCAKNLYMHMHTHVCAHLIIMLRIGIKFVFSPEHYLLERYLLVDPKLEFNLNLLLEPFSWNRNYYVNLGFGLDTFNICLY